MSKFFTDIYIFFLPLSYTLATKKRRNSPVHLLDAIHKFLWRITLSLWVLSNQGFCHQTFKLQFDHCPAKDTFQTMHPRATSKIHPTCLASPNTSVWRGKPCLCPAGTAQIQAQTSGAPFLEVVTDLGASFKTSRPCHGYPRFSLLWGGSGGKSA